MIYYPSLVVNLKLRFDEAILTAIQLYGATPPVSPDQTAKAHDGPAVPMPNPDILRTSAPFSFLANRVPKSAGVSLSGYRVAATFDLEFDFKDLPIDPQVVRSAAVEIYLGTVSPGEFADGVTGGPLSKLFGRQSIIQTLDSTNLVMVGLVDEWHVTHGGSGSVAKLTGRDLRGALLDTPIAASPKEMDDFFASINYDDDIATVCEQILALHPLYSDIKVRSNSAEWPNGELPSPFGDASVPRHRKGATGKKKAAPASAGKGGASDIHIWDLIVRTCYLVGAIPHFVGTDLVIRPSRSIFDQARAGIDPTIQTPFKDGKVRSFDSDGKTPLQEPLSYRKLVYGRDIHEVTFNRKYGGYQRPKFVRVVTIDGSSTARGSERTLTAQWPPESAEQAAATRVSPGKDASQKEYVNIPVAGVRDKAQLEEIARAVFEEIGRGEMGGSCETPNCASFAGDNNDPDMLHLKPGDGVFFAVDTRNLSSTAPLITTFTDSQRKPEAQAIAEVAKLLGDPALAIAVVTSSRSTRAQRFFRVSSVHYAWSTSGIKVNFEFQNYVVARNQVGTASSLPGSVSTKFVPQKLAGF